MYHCIVGAAALWGHEGSGGHGPAGTALPRQEGSGDGIDYDMRMADDTTRGERRTMTTSNESGCLMMQGNDNGSNNGGIDVRLRAS